MRLKQHASILKFSEPVNKPINKKKIFKSLFPPLCVDHSQHLIRAGHLGYSTESQLVEPPFCL